MSTSQFITGQLNGYSAAQSLLAKPMSALGVIPADSRTIATLIQTGTLAELGPALADASIDIPAHQRIQIDGGVFAIAHSVDALVLAGGLQSGAAMPETLDQLVGLVRTQGAKFSIGADHSSLFLALYAAHHGRLPTERDALRDSSVLEAMQHMCDHAHLITPEAAAAGLDDAPDRFAVLPFGALVHCQTDVRVSPLRLIQGGPPVAVLEWSGWGLPKDAPEGTMDRAHAVLAYDQLPRTAAAAGVWLLDGFTPDARHAGLLETIAAGAPMAPSDAKFAELRAVMDSAFAQTTDPNDVGDLTTVIRD